MTGKKIFMKRFIREWHFHWNVIHSVIDWTITLYVLVPALIIAPFLYADFWRNIPIYWDGQLPFSLLLLVILFLSAGGNIRTYLFDADLLFLIQRRDILGQLKKGGFLFSIFLAFSGVALIFIVVLPVLVNIYHFSLIEILCLYLAVCAFKLFILTIKKTIDRTIYRWILYLVLFIGSVRLIASLSSVLYGICGAVCILAVVCFHMAQLKKTNRWFRELEIDERERNKYIKFILHFSAEVEKQPVSRRKKPLLLFRHSGRLFKKRDKEHGLLELLLKTFLRNKSYVFSYYQIIVVTCLAITVLPLWLKWIVAIIFNFFVNAWLKILFKKMLANDFFTVVPLNDQIKDSVWVRFSKWVSLPPVLVILGLTAILTFLRR